MILPGDPAPIFTQKCSTNWGYYSFDMAAGKYNILMFVPAAQTLVTHKIIDALQKILELKISVPIEIFVVTTSLQDKNIKSDNFYYIYDLDCTVHNIFGINVDDITCVITDPMLRIKEVLPHNSITYEIIKNYLKNNPSSQNTPIPALLLNDVLEEDFCHALIHYYHHNAPLPSGVLTKNANGLTIEKLDPLFKRRYDCKIQNQNLIRGLQARIIRRVVPEIRKAFQCTVTGMDRMIVSCYDAAHNGHFAPHRDNTVDGAKHRLFAISINLNNTFEGGELTFPEFSDQGFRPPAGGALIFSSALLHAVRPITKGKRYACLPFAFNEDSMNSANLPSA
ncbi:2OG-Fe(II) oxygenase [Acetobacter sp. AAB5]|uniref:2OG-Fe(II) oxygenase n=1 Tax=Acetobacter sp. AAB5 TaxID=3418370 RepID=UPI003CED97E5